MCCLRILLFFLGIIGVFTIHVVSAEIYTHTFETEGQIFEITYDFDGNLLAIDIDKESTSMLIGVYDVKDSMFEISFPPELLAAEQADFIVLVDGFETDYAIRYDEKTPHLTFPIPALTEEIEIIGTSVIPEFPFGPILVMGIVALVTVVLVQKRAVFR
jgi:prepilin signal peptidase PulO-like enzyme (type II secretory pathway)